MAKDGKIGFGDISSVLKFLEGSLGSELLYRVFGSASLCTQCPSVRELREAQGDTGIEDIDIVVHKSDLAQVSKRLSEAGYVPAEQRHPHFQQALTLGSRRCFIHDREDIMVPHLLEVWWDPIQVGESELPVTWSDAQREHMLSLNDTILFGLQWPFSTWSEPKLRRRQRRAIDIYGLLQDFPFRSGSGPDHTTIARRLSASCKLWQRAFCSLPHLVSLCQTYFEANGGGNTRVFADLEKLRRLVESRHLNGSCRVYYGRVRRAIPEFI